MYGIKKPKVSGPKSSGEATQLMRRNHRKRSPTTIPPSICKSKKLMKKPSLSSESESDSVSSGDEWVPESLKRHARSGPNHEAFSKGITAVKPDGCEYRVKNYGMTEVTRFKGSRYPKREKEKPNYAVGTLNLEDDRFLYCYTCKRPVLDGCFKHPINWMENIPLNVCQEVKEKFAYCQTSKCVCGEPFYMHAAKTAPKEWIIIGRSRILGGGFGAFANADIKCGWMFGPYIGQIAYIHEMSDEEHTKRSRGGYAWLVRANIDGIKAHLVDARNALNSNWLRFVNCARFEEEQNLVAVQYRGKIYYRACKDISKSEELLTYYGKGFASELKSDIHLIPQIYSVSKDQRFQCDECGKFFTYRSNLLLHLRTIHGDQRFQCDECGKTFTQKGNLRIHMQTIHGDQRFQCDECGKTFTQKGYLRIHMQTIHGDQRFQCDECGKTFTQKGYLRIHMQTIHGDQRFQCDECGKTFTQKGYLRIHMQTIHGDQRFQCDECGKFFTYRSNLLLHLRTIHGDQRFQCDECGKTFTQKGNLRIHMQTIHGEKHRTHDEN
ncbi:unnamed protein product [Heterobilharzia americana]|nr:unnamed protein product [Heterobilharzia americana]